MFAPAIKALWVMVARITNPSIITAGMTRIPPKVDEFLITKLFDFHYSVDAVGRDDNRETQTLVNRKGPGGTQGGQGVPGSPAGFHGPRRAPREMHIWGPGAHPGETTGYP